MNHLIQPLESRLMMSVTPVEPLVPIITGEPIQAFAAVPQIMGIAYLPTVSVGQVSQPN